MDESTQDTRRDILDRVERMEGKHSFLVVGALLESLGYVLLILVSFTQTFSDTEERRLRNLHSRTQEQATKATLTSLAALISAQLPADTKGINRTSLVAAFLETATALERTGMTSDRKTAEASESRSHVYKYLVAAMAAVFLGLGKIMTFRAMRFTMADETDGLVLKAKEYAKQQAFTATNH